jgi:DNA recombination protein RmuC
MTELSTLFIGIALFVGAALAWLFREPEIATLRARAGALAQIEEKLRGAFALMAESALDNSTNRFLELATVRLEPLQDEFAKFRASVDALKKNSAEDLGSLKGSLAEVVRLQTSLQDAVSKTNDATGQLRNALQNPKVAGNWGEISLDRIIELGGMTEHCDFDRQAGMRSTDGTMERPDLTIHLTGGLNIPVDAKASAANYIRAASEPNEAERKHLLKQSAADLRQRILELRTRAYDRIEGYAGMTFMYVPNESMLSSALALDPAMIEDALRENIVIASPLLLLCYLRAFARGWSLQEHQEHADEIARRGKMLHDRLQGFFEAIGKVGRHLNQTVDSFNGAVGKMNNLLVPGRELGKLLAATSDVSGVDGVATVARDVPFGNGSNGSAALPDSSE